MENSKEMTANNELSNHPKPSDQVQNQIETVTPATENVKPTAASKPANNGNDEATPDTDAPSGDTTAGEQGDKNKSDAVLNSEKNAPSGNGDSPNDAIETVSP